MSRIIGLLVLAVLGFYVAWPAYSVMRIKNAVETDNVPLLAAKVDFPSVRVSLTPAVTAEAEKVVAAALAKSGGDNGALMGQLKAQMMPKIVELALNTIVTPESLMRIHREGGDVRKTIKDIVQEKMGAGGLGALAGVLGGGDAKAGGLGDLIGGKLGGLFGKKDAGGPAVSTEPGVAAPGLPQTKAVYGIANVKRFAITGPASYSIGVAKDQAAVVPDVEADIAFSGLDWKIVGVRPRT